MFERDKEELRSMGIPVETVSDPSGEVLGYRVPQESYALSPIELTLAERAAIAVAAQVWSRAAIANVPGTALRKLETLDSADDEWSPSDVHGTVQLTSSEAALLPLMAAIRQNRSVGFDYRAPADVQSTAREVSPWGLRSSQGRWFLIGYDHHREAQRTFRLSRITGAVTVTAKPRQLQPPEGFDVSSLHRADDEPSVDAVVRVRASRAAALRRHATVSAADPTGEADLTVTAGSRDALVSLVCAAGADATVLEPDDVVSDVVESLRAVLAAHRVGDV
jgi:proteasome accessory factor B